MPLRLLASLVLAAIAAVFVVQNAGAVDIRFLFWTLSLSLSLLMVFLLAIGLLLGWLFHSYVARRRRQKL